MPVAASLLAALIPMSLYLVLLWRFDKYEKEPFKKVFKHFLWGAIGAIALALIGSLVLSASVKLLFPSLIVTGILEAIIIAPIVEELTKGAYLFKTAQSNEFDNITDGLVYGGAIGLGFGMTENFLYFFTYGVDFDSWLNIVILRSIFSAVMHCIATATFGAFLAMHKFHIGDLKFILPISGYALAVLLHFMWNLSVSFSETFLLGLLFLFLMILLFLFVFYISITNEKKIIVKELSNENDISLLSTTDIDILASMKRNKKEWIKEEFRKDYITNAVKLAFRKHQLKHSKDWQKKYYAEEVTKLKLILTDLVSKMQQDISRG